MLLSDIGLPVPGHVTADDGDIRFGSGSLVDEFAVEHHDDSVGKLEDFVEIFADQQHRRTAITCLDDLRTDLRRRGKIQSKAGIGGDEHLNAAG